MAVEIHTVDLKLVWIGPGDKILEKDDAGTKLNDFIKGDIRQEHRVVPKLSGAGSTPSSAGYPTIAAYLDLEAAIDFAFAYMDQNMIITQMIT
jgi:hypothetical protein